MRLAGTFTPTAEHLAKAERMQALGAELFARTRASGAMRDGVTFLDVS